jgi:cytochrome c553
MLSALAEYRPVIMSVPAGPLVPMHTPMLPAGAGVALGHVRGALDVARQDVGDRLALAQRAYSGLIAAPGTPKACVTPSFSITSTAAIAAFIFAMPMVRLVDPLSDAYLREIAAHYASLDLPYPAPTPATAPAEVLQRGRRLVQQGDPARQLPACTACHGDALTGMLPATPGLLGLPRDYLVAQFGAWIHGQRRAHAPDCMADVARRLTADEVGAVSAWLASQPVPASAKPAARPTSALPLRCGSVVEVSP